MGAASGLQKSWVCKEVSKEGSRELSQATRRLTAQTQAQAGQSVCLDAQKLMGTMQLGFGLWVGLSGLSAEVQRSCVPPEE